jgi:hypothetical protein
VHHLGESTLGIWNMHEHLLRPASIETCVLEVKGLGLVDHRRGNRCDAARRPDSSIMLDANRTSLTTRKRVVAKPASKVEDQCVPSRVPSAKINSKGTAILNARAGNRGKSKRRLKTTPVLG